MKLVKTQLSAAMAVFCTAAPRVSAQCTNEPTAAQFRMVQLIAPGQGNLNTSVSTPYNRTENEGPVAMAVAPDGRVFLAKMATGEIRVFTGTANTTVSAGVIPTFFRTEDGLLGIALDPNFSSNNWLYAFFSDPASSGANRACELARFTISPGNQLTNKKVILRFPRDPAENSHAAGGIAFDANGTLVIGTGDNTDPHDGTNGGYGPVNEGRAQADAQRTASNTNDLRGKILRIKPVAFSDNSTPSPGIGTTYTIPSGNLRDVITTLPNWGNQNINLVRPEIYAFGARNPYHPRIDTRTGWIFWGDVGPDAGSTSATRGPAGHEEWNLARSPGFFGHPYCNGMNLAYGAYPGYSTKYNCAAPANASPNNTGIRNLPPSQLPLIAYASSNNDSRFGSGQETAIGGPMYRYNPNSSSTVKFPPYYEGKILFFEWTRRVMKWLVLNNSGALTDVRNFMAPNGFPATSASFIDAAFAPAGQYEGSLYMLRFSDAGYSGKRGGLYRLEYTGTYDNSCYVPFGPINVAIQAKPMLKRVAAMQGNGFVTLPPGYRSVELFDAAGRSVWSFNREQASHAYHAKLPAHLSKGVWQAKLTP